MGTDHQTGPKRYFSSLLSVDPKSLVGWQGLETELRQKISEIRRGCLQPKDEPSPAHWSKRDRMFHDSGIVHYIVLDTGGCRWALESGGCAMCGYVHDSCARQVSSAEMEVQVDHVMGELSRAKDPFGLRIFTSGSFFDEREIGAGSRAFILDKLGELTGLAELTLESRPEYVTKEDVSEVVKSLPSTEIEIALGLESSSDWVRGSCIGKGFSFEDFTLASHMITTVGARCKAYVLLKPPFLSEFDSGYDAQQTVIDVAELADSVSVNACNVQRGTLVEELFRAGKYRPPWIWTVFEVLRGAREALEEDKNVICDTVAFGTRRGPHNCRRCDKKAAAMVKRFSLSQDPSHLEGLECACRAQWARVYYYHF